MISSWWSDLRLAPLGVLLDLRDVGHVELAGQVLHNLNRDLQGIGQEAAQEPGRGRLQGKPEPVVITTAAGNQLPIRVVEEEHLLQLGPRRRHYVAAVRGRLVIA